MNAFLDDVDLRRKVAEVLGTPGERRAIRESLGLSLRDVAEATGLSVSAVQRRESEEWRRKRGSLESEAGAAYILFIARARGARL